MMELGKQRGILKPGLHPEVGLALVLGPMIYRHVFVHKLGGNAPQDLEVHVADSFLATFESKQRHS